MTERTPARFRTDLKLFAGPRDFDGSPTHNLYDPVTDHYYKLSWRETTIYQLAKPGMTIDQIVEAVNAYTTIHVDAEDVQSFFNQAAHLGLLNINRSSEQVLAKQQSSKSNTLWWLLKNYLYFRVPLVHPDKFLTQTLPYTRLLWSRTAKIFYALAIGLGLLLVLSRFDEYLHTFSYFFNLQGVIVYGAAICCVKVIHELAHAYTAKYYNTYVPTMGIAFIVMWPVLFTDVTSSWRLAQRKQRIAITVAGVVAELVVAGLSTLGWALTPPGLLQTVFFILSSVTWVTSLLININPVMRFDGYYLLCDLWSVDNLRQRAFAVGRWKMHQWLFGIDMPCPEPDLPPQKIRQLYIYCFCTVIYLMILYFAIALFVYHAFAKVLGIILFLVEIGVFFIWPVVWEGHMLYKLRDHLTLNTRSVITTIVAAFLILWLVVPWPHEQSFNAITIPEKRQELWASDEGIITDIHVHRGDTIQVGQPIASIVGQKLLFAMQEMKAEIEQMEHNIQKMSQASETRPQIAAQKASLDAAKHRLDALIQQQNQMRIVANVSGTLYDWDTSLKEGQPIEAHQLLGKIADTQAVRALAFVPEDATAVPAPGDKVQFRLPGSAISYPGVVTVTRDASSDVLDYIALASKFGGPLPVIIDKDNKLRLTATYYQVVVSLDLNNNPPLPFDKVGVIAYRGEAYSLLGHAIRNLWSLLLQESSL